MSARDNGGPAFPVIRQESPAGDVYTFAADGMTLRDYFAGQAMAAAMRVAVDDMDVHEEELKAAPIARDAYRMADAMLAERAR